MTSSEVLPAGISWAVTFSSGCSAFHALTIALPQAISSGLFESQILIGPVAVVAPSESPEPPPHAAVAPSASIVRVAVATFDLICLSIRYCGGLGSGVSGWGRVRSSRGRPAGAREVDVGGGSVVDQVEQAPRRGPSPADDVGGDRGERRLDVRRELGVLEAGDRQPAGHVDPAGGGDREPGHGHQVVGVDDRGRRLGQVEQLPGGRGTALGGEVGLDARALGQAGRVAARPPRRRAGTRRAPWPAGPTRARSGCGRAPAGARRRRRSPARRRRPRRARRPRGGRGPRSRRAGRARRAARGGGRRRGGR